LLPLTEHKKKPASFEAGFLAMMQPRGCIIA
jgi:hypothetical protein